MINFMTKPQSSTSKTIKTSQINNTIGKIEGDNQPNKSELENKSKSNEIMNENEIKINNLLNIDIKEKIDIEQDKLPNSKFSNNSKVKIFSNHYIKQKQQPFQQKSKGFLKSKLQSKSILTSELNYHNYEEQSNII